MATTKTKARGFEELRQKLLPILQQHAVARAAVFGSVATGSATEASDLDLLVEFKGEKSLLDLVALKLDLEAEINRKVDVLTYRSLSPLIKEKVLKQELRVL